MSLQAWVKTHVVCRSGWRDVLLTPLSGSPRLAALFPKAANLPTTGRQFSAVCAYARRVEAVLVKPRRLMATSFRAQCLEQLGLSNCLPQRTVAQ